MASARDSWVHGDTVRDQLEKIRKEHADGLDVVRNNHAVELAKITKERDESVSAFDALNKASTDTKKQLRIDVANANTRTEQLEKAIKEATIKIIGEHPFLRYSSLYFSRLLFVEVLTEKQNTLRLR